MLKNEETPESSLLDELFRQQITAVQKQANEENENIQKSDSSLEKIQQIILTKNHNRKSSENLQKKIYLHTKKMEKRNSSYFQGKKNKKKIQSHI